MHLHSNPDIPDGPLPVSTNPGNSRPFATIDFGRDTYASLRDVADCDRLIIAATTAKRMLLAVLSGMPHEFTPGPERHCVTCGLTAGGPIHDLTACAECGHLTCGCAADMGDDPTDSIAEGHDAEQAAAVLAGPVAAGTPVVITCGLPVWGDEDRPCELPAGHGPVVSCSAAAAPDAGTVLLAGLRAERGTGA
jgi:hypothetical protein